MLLSDDKLADNISILLNIDNVRTDYKTPVILKRKRPYSFTLVKRCEKINLKLEIAMRPVCLFLIFLLFTLLYLIIYLKINLLILLEKLSLEKALLTLHVTTDTHSFYYVKPKNIMHVLVKMYVIR